MFDGTVLIECSMEVTNKIGGIYTVMKTKSKEMVKMWGSDNYFLVGPYLPGKSDMEIEHRAFESLSVNAAIASMTTNGCVVKHGKWLVDGCPNVILFDIHSQRHRIGEWKGDFWHRTGISCPSHDSELEDAIIFGYLVNWFLDSYAAFSDSVGSNGKTSTDPNTNTPKTILHCHEWMSAVPLILQRKIPTIFTTHATILGRYLCAANEDDFYSLLEGGSVDVDEEAGKRGIYGRYCTERAAAHCASVFTTVSHITAFEAEHLLKRRPHGLLPNGICTGGLGNCSGARVSVSTKATKTTPKTTPKTDLHSKHLKAKQRISSMVQGHFYGNLDFSLQDTLFFFISGRLEYRNKGVDIFLEAVSRLNVLLKEYNSPITIVCFIIMPSPVSGLNAEAVKGQAFIREFKEEFGCVCGCFDCSGSCCDGCSSCDGCSTCDCTTSNTNTTNTTNSSILNNKNMDKTEKKKKIDSVRAKGLPPLMTHNLERPDDCPILGELRKLRLFNKKEDRVKIIYHPQFLSSSSSSTNNKQITNNAIFDIDYEDFVAGCNLGIFPSYYEPWGYTPAECGVLGVPSITSNLSGFGAFIEEKIGEGKQIDDVVKVVDRRSRGVEDSVQQLLGYLLGYCRLTERERRLMREKADVISSLLDWSVMIEEYEKAYICCVMNVV